MVRGRIAPVLRYAAMARPAGASALRCLAAPTAGFSPRSSGIVRRALTTSRGTLQCSRSRVPRRHSSSRPGYRVRVLAHGSIKINFRDAQGKELKTVEANEGDDLLSIAHEYDIDLEGTHPR